MWAVGFDLTTHNNPPYLPHIAGGEEVAAVGGRGWSAVWMEVGWVGEGV